MFPLLTCPQRLSSRLVSRIAVGLLAIFISLFFIAAHAISATAPSSGDLVKGPSAAIYYYGQDGKRYVFPNEKTYFTWYKDFSTVKTISAESLAAIPIGGNVTYRPGVKLVKITTDPKVYAVGMYGTLRWVKTEAVAISLYGAAWNKKIDDIPDAFFVNYTVGAEIGSATEFSPATETTAIQNINMDKKLAGSLIYHGVATHSWSNLVTPGGKQTENIQAEVSAYEAAVGRTVSFVEFAHEWKTDGPAFPVAVATSIKNRGATPLIFLNLRSIDIIDEKQPVEPLYTLSSILSGKFDQNFAAWADGAKNFGSEIIVDWGWEMNGDWAIWNGAHNGGKIEGPRRFREAYRHIVELMRKRGANNIRWAFHVNFPESPSESWNAFENYYPGDDVIDLIGASIYSAQFPTDNFFPSFETLFDPAYLRLVKMAPKKPVYVFEFGAAANNPLGSSATWADRALSDILSGRWPAVRGFAWWNDFWSQDTNPAHDTEMRVEKLPELAKVFRSRVSVPPPSAESRPLKTLAEARGIRFGALYSYDRRSPRHDEIFEKEMSAMTIYVGWSSTPGEKNDGITPDLDEYDKQVSWGRSRNMGVFGQTLVWFEELPDWLKAMSTANIEDMMNRRIDTLMGRYKGQIKYWNVVNEAVDENGKLRQGHKWVEAMGDDYIRKAFVRARAANPTAVLYYNDFHIESNKAKFDGVKNLLMNLKKQGAPVHALGWQMHVTPQNFDASTFLARMNEMTDLGFDNYITELDVELPENATAADYEQQKQTYKSVVETFLKARRPPQSSFVERLKTLNVWGIHDGDPGNLTLNHPYLFDENFNKKPAYFGVQEALR